MNKCKVLKSIFTLALLSSALTISNVFAENTISAPATTPSKIVCTLDQTLLVKDKAAARITAIDTLLQSNTCKNVTALNRMRTNDSTRVSNISTFNTNLSKATTCTELGTLATTVQTNISGKLKKPYDGIGPSLYRELLTKGSTFKCDKLPTVREIWVKIKKVETALTNSDAEPLPETSVTQ